MNIEIRIIRENEDGSADCGLPTYSLAYIREQQAKFELQHDLGVGIDREGGY